MSEFKVGDRVRIREDLKENEEYDGTWVDKEMLQYVGKIATIKWANDRCYIIDLDGEKYAWVKEFFEKIRTITLEELEQRIEKLEKEVFKPEETKPSLLTEDERVILRNLDKKWKWIARDENGGVYVFNDEPRRGRGLWCGEYGSLITFNHIFQFIKWVDKPYNIEELLKGEMENE